jgi:hypothetical protein
VLLDHGIKRVARMRNTISRTEQVLIVV